MHHGVSFFAAEGRLYRANLTPGGGAPRPITPSFGAFAAPAAFPCGDWIAFVHTVDGRDVIGVADASGDRWPSQLITGADFYMQPTPSPCGGALAFVRWQHPSMPWDGAELCLAALDRTEPGPPRVTRIDVVAGSRDVAAQNPVFSPDGKRLAFVSDENGFPHIFVLYLANGEVRPLTTGPASFAGPAWVQGQSRMSFSSDGSALYCVRSVAGQDRLCATDLVTGELRELDLLSDYARIDELTLGSGGAKQDDQLYAVVSDPRQSPRVIRANLSTGAEVILSRATDESLEPTDLIAPESVQWTGSDGDPVHGILYAPPLSDASDRPPLIVAIHGGPTSQAVMEYSPAAQFFATRGYAYLEVNHRGSTGYGRAYMRALDGRWGELDVDDAVTGARFFSQQGRVHPTKRVITGGSAGGYTALMAMALHPAFFTAAIVRYGVTDLFTLASDTHKFEQHYLDTLVGPLPGSAALYRERSPLHLVDRLARPIAVFQGADDRVVPQRQSDAIVSALRAKGIPHVYEVFEGEGHGFRKRETIERMWTRIEAFLLEHVTLAEACPQLEAPLRPPTAPSGLPDRT
ncbi:MAG: S9 family peptidase [Planctomycetota bacterium]